MTNDKTYTAKEFRRMVYDLHSRMEDFADRIEQVNKHLLLAAEATNDGDVDAFQERMMLAQCDMEYLDHNGQHELQGLVQDVDNYDVAAQEGRVKFEENNDE